MPSENPGGIVTNLAHNISMKPNYSTSYSTSSTQHLSSQNQSLQKILIIGPSWVGDMVMAQSLFIVLKQQHPDAIIDVLAPAWSRPIIERMPEINRAIDMPLGHGTFGLKARHKLGHDLRASGYTKSIALPNSWKSALIPWFANIPTRTGWKGEARYVLLNDLRHLDKSALPLMVQRFVALAHPKNTTIEHCPLDLGAINLGSYGGTEAIDSVIESWAKACVDLLQSEQNIISMNLSWDGLATQHIALYQEIREAEAIS